MSEKKGHTTKILVMNKLWKNIISNKIRPHKLRSCWSKKSFGKKDISNKKDHMSYAHGGHKRAMIKIKGTI